MCEHSHTQAQNEDLPSILAQCSVGAKWPQKMLACRMLLDWVRANTGATRELPSIVQAVVGLVHDARRNVGEAAVETLTELYQLLVGDSDIGGVIPDLVDAVKRPETVADTIHVLAAVVFVHEVRAEMLAILVPLLLRGLRSGSVAIKRKCCVISENMCKLVENPIQAEAFLGQLLPAIRDVSENVADPECRGVATRVLCMLQKLVGHGARRGEDNDDGPAPGETVLCTCEFSLAYGAKILLNCAKLRLVRGGRYGVCGANGCGKSTLMRAIANDQVDGFPTKDVLKRVYVEHEIDGETSDATVTEFVGGEVALLRQVGFDDERLRASVGSLSGGWKMKLALARAMAQKPDVLLLDEPTIHLDRTNVEWLEDYLLHAGVTCLIVSHDSGFLDAVCTHIIHYETLKLKVYRGNLASFVARNPQARTYYQLDSTETVFKLPEPGYLDGVKTRDKAIVKMHGVSFGYAEKPVLENVSAYVTLGSRIGCVGANGAGKSTLIKLLTGEIEPSTGTVWRHPNVRIAYVAQHAFAHIEEHLDKSANEYIRWRYATGEDREAERRVTRKLDDAERAKLDEKVVVAGVKRQIERILGRIKSRKTWEYNVGFVGTEDTAYIERDDLIDLGFEKLVCEFDMKEAAQRGMMLKPLTQSNVEKHLANLGLDAEVGTHDRIRGYSGGQKVRLVVAAATWMCPHIIVLDEPSNYLDRDSLGAFAAAIREFGGGVVVISHNREFLQSCECRETWHVANGCVEVTGATAQANKEKVEHAVHDEVVDAFGNVIKVKASTKKNEMSRKERKARDKQRKARRERGEDVSDSEDD